MARYQSISTLFILMGMTFLASFSRPVEASIIAHGQQGCLPGTVVAGPNLVQNSDFSIPAGPGPGIDPAAQFDSQLPNRGAGLDGTGVYPDDANGGGLSIQRGAKFYENGIIIGRPFEGDTQREVPPSETYFYSNVNRDRNGMPLYGPGSPGQAVLWRQTVQGLSGNVNYNFFAYFDNVLAPSTAGYGKDPTITLVVDGVTVGSPVVVAKEPDIWIPIQFSFTTAPGQTQAVLEIYDSANDIVGDDFAMTQISLKKCVSSIGVSKYAEAPLKNADDSYNVTYVIAVQNLGSDPAGLTQVQVTEDLATSFAAAGSVNVVSLTATGLHTNPGFNGVSDHRLLTGDDVLAPHGSGQIRLTVRVVPGSGQGGFGPYANRVTATAIADATLVTDVSNPSPDPDPNGNGDPKEPPEDDDTVITLRPKPIYIPLVSH
jgi:hypothetical protein